MMPNCPLLKAYLSPDKFELKKSICATWNEMEGIEIEEDSDNVVFQGH